MTVQPFLATIAAGQILGGLLSPGEIGEITKSALVLVQFEHKMIS